MHISRARYCVDCGEVWERDPAFGSGNECPRCGSRTFCPVVPVGALGEIKIEEVKSYDSCGIQSVVRGNGK